MKVDLGSPVASQELVDRNTKQVSSSDASSVQAASGDRATLSTASNSVQSLVSQALSTPQVRQDKIDALRQQVASGEYKADPGKIASGIVAESSS